MDPALLLDDLRARPRRAAAAAGLTALLLGLGTWTAAAAGGHDAAWQYAACPSYAGAPAYGLAVPAGERPRCADGSAAARTP